jgi:hypothetical protein
LWVGGVDPADEENGTCSGSKAAMPLSKIDVDQLPNANLNRYATP